MKTFVAFVLMGVAVAYGMTQADKDAVLAAHNDFRDLVANGDKVGAGGNTPQAANMLKMTWDDSIAAGAQAWADACVFAHSSSSQRPNQGENLAASTGSSVNYLSSLWFNEVDSAAPSSYSSYVFESGVGHYTQAVWAKSGKLGCRKALCPELFPGWDMYYLVCRYSPPGNYIGNEIYSEGSPQSACPSGAAAGTNALCN